MKKSILISVLLFFSIYFASAQEFKGKGIIAPAVSFLSSKDKVTTGDDSQDGTSRVSLSLAVPIGGFVSERVALGINPGYYYQ